MMCSRAVFRLVTLLALMLIPGAATAKEIRTIYLMNNGTAPADIWVNGSYQGFAPAGELVYVDKLGFVTWDSDRLQPDGTRSPTKESHGGWSGYGDVVLTICQCKKGVPYKTELKFPKEWGVEVGQGPEADPRAWFGEGSSGEEPKGDFYAAKPIYKGIESDDCGVAAKEGVGKTNYSKPKVKAKPAGWRCFRWGILHKFPMECENGTEPGLWEWADGFRSPSPIREIEKDEARKKGLEIVE